MANISTKTIIGLFKLARPVHWVKNLGIFAALVFTGWLFEYDHFMKVFWGFWVFNLAASTTYVVNDILDVQRDREHPIKKYRPVASGVVPIPLAILYAGGLLISALVMAAALSKIFFTLILIYLVMQGLYSTYFKNIPVIDILIIAAGFIIRVYSGAFVIDAHLSVWFLLCVISTALFLASGKRRAELSVVGASGKTRKSLAKYSVEVLNSYVTMFGNAAWMSWALFTFYESPRVATPLWIILAEISRTTTVDKLLMATIPVTIFGIMRYQSLIFEGRSEAPEKLLLSDTALVASVMIWVGMVVWILYGGVAASPSF